jgi:hypothetical protein
MRHRQKVHQWFATEGGGSLLLPDGWYGRPYDNKHEITSIDETEDVLTIVLSGRLTLHFEHLASVESLDHDLIFSGFDKLHFEWKSIGTSSGMKDYHGGQVKLVSSVLDKRNSKN